MTLTDLRQLFDAMLAAHKAYNRAPPDEVHHYHAEYKAARFRYNVAAGEYVAALLDQQNPTLPVIIVRGPKK